MSREIRFNAWDSINKVMIYDVAVYQNGDHIGIGIDEAVRVLDILNKREPQSEDDFFPYSISEEDFPSNWVSGESDWYFILSGFVLLQYTGLKDKNGREIYEGDIMEGNFATGLGGKSTKYKQLKFKIEYYSSRMQFTHRMIDDNSNYRVYPNIENCIVIGNIYEHPHFLNREQGAEECDASKASSAAP
jgi:uncharacterized phage protein (TIGR01671 family)